MEQTIYFMGVNFKKEETVYHPVKAKTGKDRFYIDWKILGVRSGAHS